MKDVPSVLYALPDLTDDERLRRAAEFRAEMATRRSCRMFSDRPVPRAVIEQAVLAAGTAPSGANHQPWHFSIVASPDLKHRIRLAAEEEERAFYAGKAGQEWLEALAPLGTDDDKSYLDAARGTSSSSASAAAASNRASAGPTITFLRASGSPAGCCSPRFTAQGSPP